MALIEVSVPSAPELVSARARYESQGFTTMEHTRTRVLLNKADVVVQITVQQEAQGRGPGSRRFVSALVVILVIGSLGYGLLAVTGLAPGDCTVAATGTAFNAEVSGLGADSACTKALASNSLTLFRSQPSGEVVCQYSQHFTTITVHDQGIFKLAGNAYCADLRQNFGAVPGRAPSP